MRNKEFADASRELILELECKGFSTIEARLASYRPDIAKRIRRGDHPAMIAEDISVSTLLRRY